jgi:regulator of sigma E protease
VLSTLLYFVLMLVPLVLVHEFGHYIVARWMGVRVLSFSIGFGRVLWSWQRNGTEYAIRLLPLGGYVRMLGDDPQASAEEPGPAGPDAFTSKPVWRRTLIVAAGPVFNFLLAAVLLFGGALAFDREVMSTRLGTVLPDGPAYKAGLRPGDRLTRIEGAPVASFEEIQRAVRARPDKLLHVEAERDGRVLKFEVTTARQRLVTAPELGLVESVGMIGVRPDTPEAVVAVQPDSPAWRAGLRSGDRVVAVEAVQARNWFDVEAALRAAIGKRQAGVTLQVRRLTARPPVAKAELGRALEQPQEVASSTLQLDLAGVADLPSVGVAMADRVIGVVEAGTPMAEAGRGAAQAGDEVLTVDQQPVAGFLRLTERIAGPYEDARVSPALRGVHGPALVAKLQAAVAKPWTLRLRHAVRAEERTRLAAVVAGQPAVTALEQAVARDPKALERGWLDYDLSLQLKVMLDRNERPELLFGAWPALGFEAPEMVPNAHLWQHAARRTSRGLYESVRNTVLAVGGLFSGQVPMSELGGPIRIAQIAKQTADHGMVQFLLTMVLLSVNLGVLNLLPIPLVDGGRLLFLAVEGIKRSPVTLRTQQIAAYLGVAMLGLLLVVVMKNDLQRVLPDLLDWARGLLR